MKIYFDATSAVPYQMFRKFNKEAGKVPPALRKILDPVFAKYGSGRTKARIYIGQDLSMVGKNVLPPSIVVRALEEAGWAIENYIDGYAVHKTKGTISRIGKVLNKQKTKNATEARRVFENDPQRGQSQNKYTIVISRHAYDLLGASTGRSWTSCMDQRGTSPFRKELHKEVRSGSLIAYLIKNDDRNIGKPVARATIRMYTHGNEVVKQLDDTVDPNDIHWQVDGSYPTQIPMFVGKVQAWLNKNLNSRSASKAKKTFHKMPESYNDGQSAVYMKSENFKNDIDEQLEFLRSNTAKSVLSSPNATHIFNDLKPQTVGALCDNADVQFISFMRNNPNPPRNLVLGTIALITVGLRKPDVGTDWQSTKQVSTALSALPRKHFKDLKLPEIYLSDEYTTGRIYKLWSYINKNGQRNFLDHLDEDSRAVLAYHGLYRDKRNVPLAVKEILIENNPELREIVLSMSNNSTAHDPLVCYQLKLPPSEETTQLLIDELEKTFGVRYARSKSNVPVFEMFKYFMDEVPWFNENIFIDVIPKSLEECTTSKAFSFDRMYGLNDPRAAEFLFGDTMKTTLPNVWNALMEGDSTAKLSLFCAFPTDGLSTRTIEQGILRTIGNGGYRSKAFKLAKQVSHVGGEEQMLSFRNVGIDEQTGRPKVAMFIDAPLDYRPFEDALDTPNLPYIEMCERIESTLRERWKSYIPNSIFRPNSDLEQDLDMLG